MTNVKPISFWRWLATGSGGKPGYRRLVNRWLVLHALVGLALASLVALQLKEAANTVLLPLVGILIGLSFAWAGNAQALLQNAEMEALTTAHAGGFAEYVYVYQTSVFVILVTLVVWALAGLEVYDAWWPTPGKKDWYFALKTALYGLCSLTLRECWHVVLGSQWMLLLQSHIRSFGK